MGRIDIARQMAGLAHLGARDCQVTAVKGIGTVIRTGVFR